MQQKLFIFGFSIFILTSFAWAEERQAVIDASGKNGQNSSSGYSYNTARDTGNGAGRRGEDATRSSAGKSALNVDVVVSDPIDRDDQNAIVKIRALVYANGADKREENSQILAAHGRIFIDAHGGRGGNGGRGGDGEGGGRGRRGIDATRYSSGTNGGNGYNGGNGGNGAFGSDGGNGGHVVARMKNSESYLSLLIEANTRAGDGGEGGQNGRGGDGGNGGSGGNSYSWSEVVQRGYKSETYYVDESYTDSESVGNGKYRAVRKTKRVPRTRQVPNMVTEYHSNSGGYSGSSGANGSSAAANVAPGQRGIDSKYEIVVVNEDGSEKIYQKTAQLILKSYEVHDQNGDGVYEPGEKVTVDHLVVENIGQMLVPSGRVKVLVFLQNTKWILAEPIQLEVPGLASGESYTLNKSLQFTIRNAPGVGVNERWLMQDEILPIAEVTRIQYQFGSFKLPKTLSVSYPIEISALEIPKTVGLGETVPVSFKIKNISHADFGVDAKNRQIALKFFGKDELFAKDLNLRWTDSKLKAQEEVLRDLALLKADSEMLMQGELQVSETAPPYQEVDLHHQLLLSPFAPVGDAGLAQVQQNTTRIRLVNTYRSGTESDVLLVTNASTVRAEYLEWMELFKRLGLKVKTWDLGYYKKFDLFQTAENPALAHDFTHKAVVFLNSAKSGHSDSPKVLSFLQPTELLQASRNNGLHFFVVGGSSEAALHKNLLNLSVKGVAEHADLKSLIAGLAQSPDDFLLVHRAPLMGSKGLTSDTSKALLKNAEAEIRRVYPQERFRIQFTPNEKVTAKGNIWDTVDFGSITVQRLYNPLQSNFVFLPLEDAATRVPLQSKANESLRGALLSLPFSLKLKVLKQKLSQLEAENEDQQIIEFVSECMMSDLFDEFEYLAFASPQTLVKSTRLSELLESFTSSVSPQVYKLFAGIDLYINASYSEHGDKAGKEARNILNAWKKEHLKGSEADAYDKVRDQLEAKAKARLKILVDLKEHENLRHMLVLPAIYRAKTIDQILVMRNLLEISK